MLKNFLTIAWRNLLRNKLHSLINITGLAIGVSACIVIFMIVQFELSFNKGFQGYQDIYRIHSSFKGVFSGLNRGVPTAVGPAVKDQFTGVESVASFFILSGKVGIPTAQETKDFGLQTDVVVTESSFFRVFSAYEWIAGSPESLDDPFQTVLTESKAKVYFGISDASILGKEVIYRDSLPVTVAGIVKDLPFNTDINFRDFISYGTIEKSWLRNNIQPNDWSSVNSSSQLFIKLSEATEIDKIQTQIPLLSNLYKENSEWDVENDFTLQPFADIHYNAETGIFDNSRSPAHLPTLSALIIVAIMLLIIGAINFINLETAQSIRRAKEVGVRKVLGSSQSRLVFQFLTQSFMITVFAILLSLPIAELALKYFDEFVPKGVELNIPELGPVILLLMVVVSILAGLYPSVALSSYLPVVALKNQVTVSGRNSGSAFLRKSLIVFQFTFAQILIIATLIVGWQVNFLLTKNLGFKKDAIVYFNTPWYEKQEKTLVLKNELEKIAGISSISLSDAPPAYNGWSSSTITYKGKEEIKANAYRKFGDVNYLETYGIEIIAGRNLLPSDTAKEFLINETLMKKLGFSTPLDAIGQEIEYSKLILPIVGVVKDFHIQSLHQKIEPVIIANEMKNFTCLNLQLTAAEGEEVKATLNKIEEEWKKIYPNDKIEYEFLDETIDNFYKTEHRTTKLVHTATGLAIFISCLGLFGLASYTAAQRTKEIGIRKALGATAHSIVLLLSKDFVILVLLAFILATPVAWFAGRQWLETYAYQVDLKVWLFLVTALLAVLIALITVGYQTLKAANSNPVKSLRNE
jgi:putative ABC transport system permease protein